MTYNPEEGEDLASILVFNKGVRVLVGSPRTFEASRRGGKMKIELVHVVVLLWMLINILPPRLKVIQMRIAVL